MLQLHGLAKPVGGPLDEAMREVTELAWRTVADQQPAVSIVGEDEVRTAGPSKNTP